MNKEYFKKIMLKILIAIAISLSISFTIFGTIIFNIIVFVMYLLFQGPTIYTNPDDYNKCLKSEYSQENIKHFPKNIPENAQEVNFYCVPAGYKYDGSLILLKLKVDKEYIKNELNSHKFLNS